MMWFGILIVFFTATACTQTAEISVRGINFNENQIVQGQQIYAQFCESCHGANGEGQFPDAPLVPDSTGRFGAPPHTGAGHTWHHGDELLIRYVQEGGMGSPSSFYPMPAFGDSLTEDDILLVIAYLKTLWNDEQRAYQQQATEAEHSN